MENCTDSNSGCQICKTVEVLNRQSLLFALKTFHFMLAVSLLHYAVAFRQHQFLSTFHETLRFYASQGGRLHDEGRRRPVPLRRDRRQRDRPEKMRPSGHQPHKVI